MAFCKDNYLNKTLSEVKKETKGIKKLYLGSGSKVIDQYPSKDSIIDVNDTLILKTNANSYTLPSLKGYSKQEVKAICNMLDLECSYKGYGYVSKQSISNEKVKAGTKVTFTFKN